MGSGGKPVIEIPKINTVGDFLNVFNPINHLMNQGIFGDGAKKFNDGITGGSDHVVRDVWGEITGSNKQRELDFNNKKKDEATAAYNAEIATRELASQNADVAASRGAKRKSGSGGGRGGVNFNWQDPGALNTSDFLGL